MEEGFKRVTEEVPVELHRYPPFGSLFIPPPLHHFYFHVFIRVSRILMSKVLDLVKYLNFGRNI